MGKFLELCDRVVGSKMFFVALNPPLNMIPYEHARTMSFTISEIAMHEIPGPLTVTLPQAQYMSGLSRTTLLKRASEGLLETRLVCNRRLVVVESLRKLLGFNEAKKDEAA